MLNPGVDEEVLLSANINKEFFHPECSSFSEINMNGKYNIKDDFRGHGQPQNSCSMNLDIWDETTFPTKEKENVRKETNCEAKFPSSHVMKPGPYSAETELVIGEIFKNETSMILGDNRDDTNTITRDSSISLNALFDQSVVDTTELNETCGKHSSAALKDSCHNSFIKDYVDNNNDRTINVSREPQLADGIGEMSFSLDSMKNARRKIEEQADRIHELELQLEFAEERAKLHCEGQKILEPCNGNKVNRQKTISNTVTKKVLSPDERLRIHRERKNAENQYMEKSGKWDKPSSLKKSNMVSNVKQKDEFVERLAANPSSRRRLDERKKSISRAIRKYQDAQSDENLSSNMPHNELQRMSLDEELGLTTLHNVSSGSISQKKVASKKTDSEGIDKNVEEKHEALMNRLGKGVKERRNMKQDDLPQKARRALQGHQIEKKSWAMSDQYQDIDKQQQSDSRKSENESGSPLQKEYQLYCQTCQSIDDCEEDVDNPGVFYCASCWEEYETGIQCSSPKKKVVIEKNIDVTDCIEQNIEGMALNNNHLRERALWIVHDNPQLANQLVCNGGKKMNCMLETKDPISKDCVRIILGTIDYCGNIAGSDFDKKNEHNTNVGTECIRLVNNRGFLVDQMNVETRSPRNESVVEFKLDTDTKVSLTGKHAQMSAKNFLKDCNGRVDVILDPQCAPGGWYPLKESDSSSQKIAPQFRSKGVGYIRLGDDMSNNGLAFLSSDCCKSFLNDTENLRSTSNNYSHSLKGDLEEKTSSSLTERTTVTPKDGNLKKSSIKNNRRPKKLCHKKYKAPQQLAEYDSSSEEDKECDCTHVTQTETGEDAFEVLKELQNSEVSKGVKWHEKADLLTRLGIAVGKSTGKGACTGSLKYIQDLLSSKNINVHVVRASLSTLGKIGKHIKKELVEEIAWTTIMIKLLNLLRNKQIHGVAKKVLEELHGECYTLANSLTSISHVLGIGKGGKTGKGKISLRGASVSTLTDINQISQSTNSTEVIQWLAETVEMERQKEIVEPLMEKNDLELLAIFFLGHESHRDSKCRKNALDGLLHTMVYGIINVGMSIEEVQNICLDLKTSNARTWARLIKSVCYLVKQKKKI